MATNTAMEGHTMVIFIPPFEAINQTTPFTYRDNRTYLGILADLRDGLNQLNDDVINVDTSTNANINSAIARILTQVNATIDALEIEWLERIGGAVDNNVVTFDPTKGQNFVSTSKAMSNVYDNVRVFAYFAKQYDELEMTALEYDTLELTARQYDLAPLTTINATQ